MVIASDKQAYIKAFKAWQECPLVHPFTCGKDSNHLLETNEIDNGIYLFCPTCGWVQSYTPALPSCEEIEQLTAVYIRATEKSPDYQR